MTVNNRAEPMDDRSLGERRLRIALGKRIRQLRKKRGWSQAELALHLEVRRTTLLRWERGALPPVGMLILLSDVLDVTLDALLAGRTTTREDPLTQDQRKAAALHLNKLASLLRLRPREPRD